MEDTAHVARTVPINYILLLAFTIAEGYLVGVACSAYDATSILAAVGMTTAIVAAVTVYACYTKTDYTMQGGLLLALLVALIVFGLLAALSGLEFMRCLYCLGGAVLFSFYIIFDTQLVIGRGKVKFSVDDYIMAAMNIYLDIINLLLLILELIGSKRN